MQNIDGPGHPSAFLQSQNGISHLPTRYVPGKIVPVRPPPPPKSLDSANCSSRKPERGATFTFSPVEQRRQAEAARRRHRNTLICFAFSSLIFFIVLAVILGTTSRPAFDENCPDQNPAVKNWNPGHDTQKKVVIGNGERFSLDASATVYSITIQKGGLLVFADDAEGSKNITLKTRYILIKDGGVLHIGAEKCRYKSKATIILYGKSDEEEELPPFGKKFIGVDAGGSLELHGTQKLSWTQLAETLPSTGLASGSYSFVKNFSRGLNVRVIDQDTAQVLILDRFDTHDSENESTRLHTFLRSLDPGRIVAIAVGDSAAKCLLSDTKQTIKDLLGSRHVDGLIYRQSWALVGVIGGGDSFCSEEVEDYMNHNTAKKALARRAFTTVNGVNFSVSAYSEWIEGVSWSGFHVEVADGTVLNLLDDVQSWKAGDRIVIASTDYSMNQAEEFTLLPCLECSKYQVKIKEKPQFLHVGEIIDGIDMRAEVGVLTRNIVIQGQMEDSCYGSNMCQFFSNDTFGGHIQILKNFTSVHMSNVEIRNMGQQMKNRYPVHFYLCGDVDEKGGYKSPTYVESLSIHHCFSRCVGIHATNGLLVKDTIGYDTLGHCFFLEDGIEERNMLYHNLGLLTKPGTLLPTDRNDTMCTAIRNKVYGSYIPVPATDCKAVSTFWIANPNNHLISNAAAGSQDAGIWYLFHKMSTGDSHGLYPETKAELTPLGLFYNNRVHSNFKAGLFIDKGVKTTQADASDPREYLCLDNSARFRPHENADQRLPRVPAQIDSLITFKNNDHGAWVRGGDIIISNSAFADNGIGLTFASDGSFPKDEGASQTVLESLFIGESRNYGFHGGQNKYFGIGGLDNKNRTLPRNKTFPIRGFQIYDGPIHLTKSTFRNFVSTPDRYTSAVGFFMKNSWQLTPKNRISLAKFDANVSIKVFFGKPGLWFEDSEQDGDKNSVFNDLDGSVTGYKDTLVGRMDNYLIRHPDCINVTEWNGVICKGKYAQIYVQTWNPPNLTMAIVRDEYPDNPMMLRGINQRANFQQYQPVVMLQKGYTVHWNGQAPEDTVLYLINFDRNDWIRVGLCYPPDTTFQVKSDIYQRQTLVAYTVEEYGPVSSLDELLKMRADRKFYFDNSTGLLFIYLQAKYDRDGYSYCSSQGCERVKITAAIRSKQLSNCMTRAYPKYKATPTIITPIPSKNTAPCKACGTAQVVFTSDPQRTYLPVQIKSLMKTEIEQGDREAFISVNGTKFIFKEVGTFIVIVDACTGSVAEKRFFSSTDAARMVGYLNTGIPQRSIVLLGIRGEINGQHNISETLVSLGTAKAAQLKGKGSLAFYGFKGRLKPSWTELFTSPAGQGLGFLEKYIPLQMEEYECTKVSRVQRKDTELLKKVRRAQ